MVVNTGRGPCRDRCRGAWGNPNSPSGWAKGLVRRALRQSGLGTESGGAPERRGEGGMGHSRALLDTQMQRVSPVRAGLASLPP